jgi:hypothetical protein
MTPLTGPPSGFALESATAVVLVGSRVDGNDYPGSDIDYLGLFPAIPDRPVDLPGARRMASTLGDSWTVDLDGEEVNVERVRLDVVRTIAGLLREPVTADRFVSLQPYELRLLDRLRSGRAVTGGAAFTALRDSLPLERLPIVAFVGAYHAARSNLAQVAALLDQPDRAGALPADIHVSLVSAAYSLAATAASLHGKVIPMVKKMPPILRRLARTDPAFHRIRADVAAIVTAGSPRDGVRTGQACLAQILDLARERAGAGEPGWREACDAV